MPRQIVTRILLVCAVLFAQQTALAHDYWHASSSSQAPAQKAPKGDKLCDLHDLLGTVLGVAAAGALEQELLSVSESGFTAIAEHAAHGIALTPHSRGPPPVS
jgi:hypothetical protein